MPQVLSKTSKTRIVLVAWGIAWMLMIPLFHVHPEADHHHGKTGHVHGGVLHTVFSPDLACEHAARVHDSNCLGTDHQHFQANGHFGHLFGHPEIEFSLLSASNDHSAGKLHLGSAVHSEGGGLQVHRVVFTSSSPLVSSSTVLFLSTGHPLRAPPSLSL